MKHFGITYIISTIAVLISVTSCDNADSENETKHSADTLQVDSVATAQDTTSIIDTTAQKPQDGTYTYDIAFAEWQGKSMGETCTVIIKGDSIKVLYDGKGKLSAKKGEVLDQGILIKHESGKWIIGSKPEDKHTTPVGGCSGGPNVIDFKNKKFWMC